MLLVHVTYVSAETQNNTTNLYIIDGEIEYVKCVTRQPDEETVSG